MAPVIREVLIEPLLGGFVHDDQAALRVGARDAARVPAAAVGIGLVLDDGTLVWGDAVSVQYAGAGGRDPMGRGWGGGGGCVGGGGVGGGVRWGAGRGGVGGRRPARLAQV